MKTVTLNIEATDTELDEITDGLITNTPIKIILLAS